MPLVGTSIDDHFGLMKNNNGLADTQKKVVTCVDDHFGWMKNNNGKAGGGGEKDKGVALIIIINFQQPTEHCDGKSEWKSMKPANLQSFNATGPLSPTAKCNSFKPSNFSNFKSFLAKKLGDEDDLRVPSNNQLN
ncbi:hypothetical protein Q3G72_027411 [Acer saccharum]|nr:hypothetical protein Q3G72_027411 [Acer saccharum]